MKIAITFWTLCLLWLATPLFAQNHINYTVEIGTITHEISPYIYGVNGQNKSGTTANRSGGNRLTGYNWETNYSNAGEDYIHHSDFYLSYMTGVDESEYDVPGIVLTSFVDHCNQENQYSLVTLPMAGYVAADADGTVEESETAPSSRWNRVELNSPYPGNTTPDLNDQVIYVEQEIDFLIENYGLASSGTGVRGYSLDNEPALWPYTHPRIHPDITRIGELIQKSQDMAVLIKSKDPGAEVYGPALYGFYAMFNLQDATDWDDYVDDYPTFLDAYLDGMGQASQANGSRLLDVLDVHWYPSQEGIYYDQVDDMTSISRMNAPRSLWDPSYTEGSWISDFLEGPIQMINRWKTSINNYYPGTKLAITEYDYAAPMHISGGIAQIEALGAFALSDVYFASKWNAADGFIGAAYDMFLNVDGQGTSFGDNYVLCASGDIDQSSIFSSKNNDNEDIHIIVTNRSLTDAIDAAISLSNNSSAMSITFDEAEVYILSEQDSTIQHMETLDISGNTIELTIPKTSAVHIVAKPDDSTSAEDTHIDLMKVYPSVITKEPINIELPKSYGQFIAIHDAHGKLILQRDIIENNMTITTDAWSSGLYIVSVLNKDGDMLSSTKVIKN